MASVDPRTRGTPVVFALGSDGWNAARVKLLAVSNAPEPRPAHGSTDACVASGIVGAADADTATREKRASCASMVVRRKAERAWTVE